MKSRHVLVTGAGGFIGAHLCRYLRDAEKISVAGISRSPGRGYHKIDILDGSSLKKFLSRRRPQVIFHSAGGRDGGLQDIINDNLLTTICLFESIRSVKDYHPRVVVIGSAAEYGASQRPWRLITEKKAAAPLTLYGRIKAMQTKAAFDYSRWGEDVVIARLFNITGPGIPESAAAGYFARCIVAREGKHALSSPFKVGRLDGLRDFLDVRDICEALHLLSIEGKAGEVYNICSQKKVIMRDLLNEMIASSHNPRIKFIEDRSAKGGVPYAVGSCVKLARLAGWEPCISLHKSLTDTLESYRIK